MSAVKTHRYLLGAANIRASHPKKLSKFDVEDMRRWARTDGFGLPVLTQAKWLHATYSHVTLTTLKDVLTNDTWCDLTYDRDARLPGAPVVPQFGVLASLIALIRLLCGEVTR